VEFTGRRTVAVVEEAACPLQAHEVRVQTFYSGISAGTELTTYRNTNPYLHVGSTLPLAVDVGGVAIYLLVSVFVARRFFKWS
jgi:hypothetical protein